MTSRNIHEQKISWILRFCEIFQHANIICFMEWAHKVSFHPGRGPKFALKLFFHCIISYHCICFGVPYIISSFSLFVEIFSPYPNVKIQKALSNTLEYFYSRCSLWLPGHFTRMSSESIMNSWTRRLVMTKLYPWIPVRHHYIKIK